MERTVHESKTVVNLAAPTVAEESANDERFASRQRFSAFNACSSFRSFGAITNWQ
jgi:hypothetical protein